MPFAGLSEGFTPLNGAETGKVNRVLLRISKSKKHGFKLHSVYVTADVWRIMKTRRGIFQWTLSGVNAKLALVPVKAASFQMI
jgi:hypothetical protein